MEVTYVNEIAKGPYKEYYESGNLREEGVFTNTEKNGYYTRYYDMSNSEANAVLDAAASALGESNTTRYTKGMPQQTGIYKDGKDIKD